MEFSCNQHYLLTFAITLLEKKSYIDPCLLFINIFKRIIIPCAAYPGCYCAHQSRKWLWLEEAHTLQLVGVFGKCRRKQQYK